MQGGGGEFVGCSLLSELFPSLSLSLSSPQSFSLVLSSLHLSSTSSSIRVTFSLELRVSPWPGGSSVFIIKDRN